MKSTYVYLFFLLTFVEVSFTMYSSKSMEGFPSGYLGDCPGQDRHATITKKTLKYLSFVIQADGPIMTAKRTPYNYYQMKELSMDRRIDLKKRKTVVYVGGFLDSPNFPFAGSIVPQYKKLGYNVLCLDTNRFTTMEYPLAAVYMRTVGQHAAEMLLNLTQYGLDPKRTELVGLSLGGQTVSFIAKNYRMMTGMNISRITALDPAGPCFRNLGPEDRLDQSDADFVDVVSTNIDGFGMAAPVGHVNFYINGGEFQPGDIIWMPCNVFCSHIRSFTLWISALQHPNSFIAMECDSVQDARNKNCYDRVPQVTNVLGLNVDRSKEGIFFLATDNNYPYYLGKKGLKKENEFFWSLMKGFIDNSDMIM